MKILIEESVLRQALETFTHCYAETDRRINERAKILVELRTVLDAAEKVEPVAWMITTDNTNLHPLDPNKESNWLAFDVNQFRNDSARALVISDTQPLYLHPALDAAEGVEPIFWYRPLENGCYEGPKHNSQMEKVRKTSGVWVPLYTHPAPTTLVDSLAEKIAIATREIEGWKAVADAGEKIIAARDEQIAELEEKIKQQIRFRGEALRERDELLAELKRAQKWIAHRGNGLPDHACAQCVPHSDILIEGFVCAYHTAIAKAKEQK